MVERTRSVETVDAAPSVAREGVGTVVRERAAPPEPLRTRLWRRLGGTTVTVINLVLFFALWQWAVSSGRIPQLFVPLPADIVTAFIRLAETGQLWLHFSYSATNFVVGFALAIAIGIPVGLAMGASRWIDVVLGPYVWSLYSMPRIALTPLFILWLGFGMESKVMLIFLSGLFPVLINAMAGVKTVDQSLLKAGRVFGATRLQLYSRVILPFTVPFVMAGIVQGISRALVGLVVAEFLGSSRGIGFVISRAGQQMNGGEMFAMLILLAVCSVALIGLARWLEQVVAPWREEVRV